MNPVTLHDVYADQTVVGLRLECPHTGQVLTVALPLDQQRELLASLTRSVARGERIDPHAPAVARLADWHAQHAQGCPDCDPTPAPCTCEIARAEPLIGRAHSDIEAAILADAMNGRR